MLAVLATSLMVAEAAEPKKLLVVTATKGFRHSSIPTAEKVIAELGQKSGLFTVEYVRGGKDGKDDAEVQEKMTPELLAKYDGVIFANTTGDLAIPDREAFIKWIESGKAFIGMHSAGDTFHNYRPFIEMIGGEFQTHGAQAGVECLVQDAKHPSTKHLGESYCIEQEEIYLFKSYDPKRVHELLVLDKHPNKKTEAGRFPIAWCREQGKGKIWYSALGHREDVWESKRYQQHILGGIKWALGLEPGDATPQAK